MDVSALPFVVSSAVSALIAEIEEQVGREIVVREGQFNRFDEPASVQGGFDHWTPHVTVNSNRRGDFDEHGLAHELLHVRRFVGGAFILETPEHVAGIRDDQADIRKAFANDVTNQIEHIAIFPQLEAFGFDPHVNAEQWKENQIAEFAREQKRGPDQFDHSWLAIKAGVSEFLGKSPETQRRYLDAIARFSPHAITKGSEIAGLIGRYGLVKPYNLRRLYEVMLRTAGLPNRALLLKQFHFDSETETREPVP